MSDWQLIGTAPKDGTPILLFSHADVGNVTGGMVWVSGGWRVAQGGGWRGDYAMDEPTHWMPLPASPVADPPQPQQEST